MFGVKQIVEGWVNDVFDKEQELYEKRIKICKECPLYTVDRIFKGKCDGSKCWDTINDKLVNFPGKNIICGCGCKMSAKTRLKESKCVLNKW